MKKKLPLIIPVLLLLTGIGIFTYPHIMQRRYVHYAQHLITSFQVTVENFPSVERIYNEETHAKTPNPLRDLLDMMAAYNAHLYQTNQANLTSLTALEAVDFSLLPHGFPEEMIGFITIPRMDIELPIFLGATEANLTRGAAHLTQTSLPIGGINTNTVISAHRGMSTAAMFREIEQMQIGDHIYITNFYEVLTYQVIDTRIILPHEINHILIQSGQDLVTLITCHPLRHNFQRYLVFAERVLL